MPFKADDYYSSNTESFETAFFKENESVSMTREFSEISSKKYLRSQTFDKFNWIELKKF